MLSEEFFERGGGMVTKTSGLVEFKVTSTPWPSDSVADSLIKRNLNQGFLVSRDSACERGDRLG